MAGIGYLSDLAIGARFGTKRPVFSEEKDWRANRRHAVKPPKIAAGGSNNHALAARVLDLVTGHRDPGDHPKWGNPREWLAAWYELMAEAHDAYEALSPVYGDVHLCAAMLSADAGIPGARAHLTRTLALYHAHLCDGHLVHAGTRAKRPAARALEQWTLWQLGLPVPKRPKPQRPLRLAQSLSLRLRLLPLSAALRTVRLAPGELRIRRYEHGRVSYFPSGPRCYAYPQPAAVASEGQAPIYVRPPYSPRRGKEPGPCVTRIEAQRLITTSGSWHQEVDLSPLGELVEEIVIPRSAA